MFKKKEIIANHLNLHCLKLETEKRKKKLKFKGFALMRSKLMTCKEQNAKCHTSEISKQSSTRTLRHIIGHVENPKPKHKHSDGSGPHAAAVAKQPANIGGVTDDQNGEGDARRPDDDERPPAAKSTCASVAHVADHGLDY